MDRSLLAIVAFFGIGVALLVVRVAPVSIRWETASEIGTAGYNIYRSPHPVATDDLAWTRVNAALIPAQGDEVMGARYRYDDHNVHVGRRYQYRIEEVEWGGLSTLYPESVHARAGLPLRWTRLQGAGIMLVMAALLWHKVKQNRMH